MGWGGGGGGGYLLFSDHPGTTRETREGWPLLTVETEVNGDSRSTNERGPPHLSHVFPKLLYFYVRKCIYFSDMKIMGPMNR